MLTAEQNLEIWKENLRKNAEANPAAGALRLIESTPHSGAFPVTTGSLPPLPRTMRACKMGSSHSMATYWEIWDGSRKLAEAPTLKEAHTKARQRLAAEAGENKADGA